MKFSQPNPKVKLYAWALFASLAVSFGLFGNTITGDFVHDDKSFVSRPELREPISLIRVWSEPLYPDRVGAGLYRPLSTFSFSANFVLFGESPVSFHVVNIILHGLVTFLFFSLVYRLFGSIPLAIFTAGFYAIMPIHTEAVANIKGRDEILAGLFFLLSWHAFIQSTRSQLMQAGIYMGISALLLYFSILSKELMLIGGLTFPLVGWLKGDEHSCKGALKKSFPFTMVIGLSVITRFSILGNYAFGSDGALAFLNPLKVAGFWVKVWAPFQILFYYVGNTFTSFHLSASYHFNHIKFATNPFLSAETLSGMVFFLTGVLVLVFRKLRNTALSVGLIAFWVNYLLISRILFISGGDVMAERWIYVPSLGLAVIGGYGLEKVWGANRRLGLCLCIVLLIYFSNQTIRRNDIWLSSESLYASILSDAPDSIYGYMATSIRALDRGDLETARYLAVSGLQIIPNLPLLWDVMANIALKEQKYDTAEDLASKALSYNDDYFPAYLTLSKVAHARKDNKKALTYFEKFAGNPYVDWQMYVH